MKDAEPPVGAEQGTRAKKGYKDKKKDIHDPIKPSASDIESQQGHVAKMTLFARV